MGKRGLGLGMIIAIVGATSTAHATPQWRLVYVREHGAELCPEEMELRLAVAARLGRDPFSSGASSAVVARIGQQGDQLSGSVELVDDAGISRGKRELHAGTASCDDMARAVALSISIAVDPDRAQVAASNESTAKSPAEIDPGAAPASPLLAANPEIRRDRRRRRAAVGERAVVLSLSALSAWGVGPALAWGGAFRAQKRFGWLALGADALAVTSPNEQVRVGTLGGSLVAAGLEACARPGGFELCAVGLAGATWARANDVALPNTDVGRFLAAGGRLGFGLPLSRTLDIFADASVFGVAFPVRATVDDARVWTAPPLVIALGAGAKFQFL